MRKIRNVLSVATAVLLILLLATACDSGGPSAPVTAGFQITSVTGLFVQFRNTSDPGARYFEWSFGDGSPVSNEVDPAHTFPASGTYTITLLACPNRDSGADQCDTAFGQVTVNSQSNASSAVNAYQVGKIFQGVRNLDSPFGPGN